MLHCSSTVRTEFAGFHRRPANNSDFVSSTVTSQININIPKHFIRKAQSSLIDSHKTPAGVTNLLKSIVRDIILFLAQRQLPQFVHRKHVRIIQIDRLCIKSNDVITTSATHFTHTKMEGQCLPLTNIPVPFSCRPIHRK